MAPSHRYNLIDKDDETKDVALEKTTPSSIPWWKILLGIILAASAGLGATFAVALGFPSTKSSSDAVAANVNAPSNSSVGVALPTTPSDPVEEKIDSPDFLKGKILDCGYSPSEARAKGCVFDVMMQDWVPEPCYDGVLTERYLAEGNWTWYADGDGKVIISDEDMRKGEHGGAWMASSYHQAHCIFSWAKTVRALRNNEPISQELLSYDHVLHCSMGALSDKHVTDEGVGVLAPTNYAKCALYSTWTNHWIPDKHSSVGDGSMADS